MRQSPSFHPTLIINNGQIAQKLQSHYTVDELQALRKWLTSKGTFNFSALSNGLFPAAAQSPSQEAASGYDSIWIRDNVYIAFSHFCRGQVEVATKNMRSLLAYFLKYQNRFEDIISGHADPQQPMNRPQIRFDGQNLTEIDQIWAHAQNDALGYFLWFYCRLLNQGALKFSDETAHLLAIFVLFFEKIAYWDDEDSGHWEEVRKQSASSIGVVLASLYELQKLMRHSHPDSSIAHNNRSITIADVQRLIDRGENALIKILPSECIQTDRHKQRAHDAALLFLIYPLDILQPQQANAIVENVKQHLQGDYGIRRYPGDSYWAPDYKKMLAPEHRTQDFSNNIADRDLLLAAPGAEAQWCIFDPIISVIHGKRYQHSGKKEELEQQTFYLNRSLAQITAEQYGPDAFRCPELYYREDGAFVPNDHLPLYWTQANLLMALHTLEVNVQVGTLSKFHQNGKAKVK